jgi:riboflavin kinase / FMN adenylyltransferase
MIVCDLDELPPLPHPIALTIGNFDGIHLGHQQLLQELKRLGTSVVITFRNHPSDILRSDQPVPLLCTLDHKLNLLRGCEVDAVALLDFTSELAQQSPDEFLAAIRTTLPFDHLVLGYDGRIGSKRSGTPERLAAIAQKDHFSLHYLPALTLGDLPISSGRIRKAIGLGDLDEAACLLGRPLSYYATVHTGAGMGHNIGFPTANLDIAHLCPPPFGVYAVSLRHENHLFEGVANYGIAPTLHSSRKPLFEVHLFSFSGELYGAEVELTLRAFLRAERHFSTVEELKQQIARDIQSAKTL